MALYRTAFRLYLALVLLPGLLWRRLRGRESRADLAQRFGRERGRGAPCPGTPSGAPGRTLWLHGASVGELASARPLAEALLRRDPGLRLVVTANTVSGRASVCGWGLARVAARLAPLDLRGAAGRFWQLWQPQALVQLEKELWPERMRLAAGRGAVVMQAAALMSARSAAGWARVPRLARAVLGTLDLVAAQDAPSEARLLALGLPPARLGPRLNLKAAAGPPPPDPQVLAGLAAAFPRTRSFLAASTHAGEEAIVLAAFAEARRELPELRLILAPRHPERGAALARQLAALGLPFARRSAGQPPQPGGAVYLADTLGEMGLWFSLAQAAFVGGSLVDKGGHTPFEPARLGCAILHGPHVGNNAGAYRSLHAQGAAQTVRNADELARAFLTLARAPERAEALAARAKAALVGDAAGAQAIEAFAERLLARLPPAERHERRG